ncbi:MAG: bifunctional methylenetetrahydrofolate dehydrogenase/methenyltetrahydrofolate cyclohydrolase FolD [Verrucomicrobiae bacterium]|nr:bifunctional methylenetetrahydrofolate dehydrogenase/methenyltetrahydrofolate cyclohydrolase FolD [Verrucomicrobiae bacterium]
MSAQLIDGKVIAEQIHSETKAEVDKLALRGIKPGIGLVRVGDDPASVVYVGAKGKACEKLGIYSENHILPASTTQKQLLELLDVLNASKKIHGILVQSPLPNQINEELIFQSVSPAKDVDGFHPVNIGKLLMGETDGFWPCTPAGVQQLLIRSGVKIEGAHVVVVGRSNIVGKPVAAILVQKAKHADATVTICHSRTRNLAEITRTADILVAAMGRPKAITADMVREGVVVIDVGVNRIPDATRPKGERLVGDVDFDAVKEKASRITPVPGGVGPMTIAMLMHNTVKACRQQTIA